ncbi:MAG TPA: hypothetical protein VFX58_02010 [Chitinophagaceae bacterium]|nr:hypothetical protein [Chitinophagaceae bacterium]
MEVHTHTHTARKKWTHYFWEFLMLFLAVFCGFLAEYQLEHKIERDRGKEYAKTLYEDIKTDTANLQALIRVNKFITPKIDSFRFMVQHYPIDSLPAGNWYYYGRFGTRYLQIAFQDATLQQLKNSGGLRYFKNKNVVDAIARYDQSCRVLQNQLEFQNPFYADILRLRDKLFNAYYLDEVMSLEISKGKIDSFKLRSMPLLSHEKEDFIQYANICQIRSNNNKNLLTIKLETLKSAEKLLEVLKGVYRLE